MQREDRRKKGYNEFVSYPADFLCVPNLSISVVKRVSQSLLVYDLHTFTAKAPLMFVVHGIVCSVQ